MKRRANWECSGFPIYLIAPYLVPLAESISEFWRKLSLIGIPEQDSHFGSLEDQILVLPAPGKWGTGHYDLKLANRGFLPRIRNLNHHIRVMCREEREVVHCSCDSKKRSGVGFLARLLHSPDCIWTLCFLPLVSLSSLGSLGVCPFPVWFQGFCPISGIPPYANTHTPHDIFPPNLLRLTKYVSISYNQNPKLLQGVKLYVPGKSQSWGTKIRGRL